MIILKKVAISLSILALLCPVLFGCDGAPTTEVKPTTPAIAAAPETLQPTHTPMPPTSTPAPPTPTLTNTPKPTNTPTPKPTNTPQPTNTPTPEPTNTPKPPTNTPAPPTDTPIPTPPSATPNLAVALVLEHYMKGLDYTKQKNWDEAIAEFQEAIKLDPKFGLAYEGLGYSYALGKKDYGGAIKAFETYLQLVPKAKNRAEVESLIQKMREMLASTPLPEPPPGKAIFYFLNYSGEQWNVDIGPYFLEAPPNKPGQKYQLSTVVIDPGTYTWQAHSANAGYYITDGNGNKAFEFTVAAGESYGTSCCN